MTEDGTPTVTTNGEDDAPTPSADRGQNGAANTLQDHVQQALEARFGSESADTVSLEEPPSPEPEPAPEPSPADAASPEPQETAPSADTDTDSEDDLDPEHPDAMVDALAKPDESAEAQPDAEEASAEESSEGEDDLPDDVSDEELNAQHPRTRRRVKKLLRQRAELRAEVEQAKPVMSFIAEHKLQGDDVQLALGMTAALQRGDFKGFLDGVMPLVNAAQQYMGTALSPELQEKVNQGYITLELAQQLQASQSQAAWSGAQQEKLTQQQQQEAAQREAAAARTVIAQAVTNWETQIKESDPDYARKQPLILTATKALVAERGAPKTQEEALQLAKDAYEQTNKLLATVNPTPPPRPTRAVPDTGVTQRSAEPEPGSMFEAVKQGLRRAHSA